MLIIKTILHIILPLVLPIIITVAFYKLAERKIIFYIKPLRAVFYFFIFSPILTFLLSLLALNFMCFKFTIPYFDEYLIFFFFFSISSFNIFGITFEVWSSNSKYTVLEELLLKYFHLKYVL